MHTKLKYLAIPVAVALVAGCHRGPRPDAKSDKATVAPIPVTTQPAQLSPVAKELIVNGTIIARNQVNVMPKTTGRILQLKVDEGTRVRKGQVIAVLETPELSWQLQQQKSALVTAEANLDQARDNLKRMKELAGEGVISQQQLIQAQTQTKVAEASVRQSKDSIALMESQLANGTITSPINGVVISKGLDVGAMAVPSSTIVTIAEAGDLQAKLPVAERDLGVVHEGGSATITSVALPGETFSGKISEIAPMVDPQTRLVSVKVDLARTQRLRVGMNVSAAIAGSPHQGLVVPTTAVLTDGAEQIVYLANGPKAQRVAVTIGVQRQDWTEVTQGLKSGDPVIVKGASFVHDGDPITRAGGAS